MKHKKYEVTTKVNKIILEIETINAADGTKHSRTIQYTPVLPEGIDGEIEVSTLPEPFLSLTVNGPVNVDIK